MRGHLDRLLAVLILVVALASSATAGDTLEPSPPPPRATGGGLFYDPRTVETVRGEIVGLGEFVPAPSGPGGVYRGPQVELKTKTETVAVRLGPPAFLERHGLRLKLHDRLEVTGTRVQRPKWPLIIARKVKTPKGKEVILLTEAGFPLWYLEKRGAPPTAP